MGSVLRSDTARLVSLGAVLVSAELCSDGLRLLSATRRSLSAPGQMAEKDFTGDVTSGTRMHVYENGQVGCSKRHMFWADISGSSFRFGVL